MSVYETYGIQYLIKAARLYMFRYFESSTEYAEIGIGPLRKQARAVYRAFFYL